MNLTFEVPDELARSLEGIAATQHMSIQQLTLDRLRSWFQPTPNFNPDLPLHSCG